MDLNEFLKERARLENFVKSTNHRNTIKDLLDLLKFIARYRLVDALPNANMMLRIFLTCSVSVATCERSFSKLKPIKSCLRSTMNQLRLISLGILSIEREQAALQIDFDEMIKNFSRVKARKIKFIQCFFLSRKLSCIFFHAWFFHVILMLNFSMEDL